MEEQNTNDASIARLQRHMRGDAPAVGAALERMFRDMGFPAVKFPTTR